MRSLGFDAETAAPLEDEIAGTVCTPEETAEFALLPAPAGAGWPKLAFSAKEALYKCAHPVLHRFLDFSDVRLRFGLGPGGKIGDPDAGGDGFSRGRGVHDDLRHFLLRAQGPRATARR